MSLINTSSTIFIIPFSVFLLRSQSYCQLYIWSARQTSNTRRAWLNYHNLRAQTSPNFNKPESFASKVPSSSAVSVSDFRLFSLCWVVVEREKMWTMGSLPARARGTCPAESWRHVTYKLLPFQLSPSPLLVGTIHIITQGCNSRFPCVQSIDNQNKHAHCHLFSFNVCLFLYNII